MQYEWTKMYEIYTTEDDVWTLWNHKVSIIHDIHNEQFDIFWPIAIIVLMSNGNPIQPSRKKKKIAAKINNNHNK